MRGLHCLTCDTVIVSRHRYDFVACRCPRTNDPKTETYIYVDGGSNYKRFGAGHLARFTEAEVPDE